MGNETKKFALITGATSGIGRELTKLFAKDHYNLVLVARSKADLERTASELEEEYKISTHVIAKDLFKKEVPQEIYDEVRSEGIEIDILVNDAGQGQYGEFVNTEINRELDIIQLNIGAYIMLTKLFLKDMIYRERGKILNVGSIAGEIPGPLQSVYHGTKAFVNSWSEAIREEVKDKNVSITVLLPGPTDTDFFEKADMLESKIVQEGKLKDPAKVAKAGYKALMNGEDKVISGLKNKVQVAMSNFKSDEKAAEDMHDQQAPVDAKK